MNNKPKLRFKDKNGNAYPEWEEKKIGDICKINMGQSPDSSSYNDNKDGIPLIQGNADILNRVTFPKRYTNKPTKICEIGSLIMTVRAPVGYIAKSYHKACIGRGVCELIPKESTDFLFQFMQKIEDSWKKIEQGSTFSAVNRNDIENLRINIPCLNEQEKIAGFLSKVDELINECESEVKDLEEQKKGLMQKIFSQQIRFKDSNNNPYPDWEEKKIGDICKINMGQSPDSSSYNDKKDGIPLIQGNADILNRVTFPKRYTNKPTKICEIGSLIMTVRAPVGYIAKSCHKACIGRGVCELIPKESTDFLFQFMQTIEDSWKKIEQGSTFSSVNRNDIENLRINIPCLEEQEKIAKVLSKMDELIEEKKALLSDWQQFKKGLLQQMFV